MFDLNGTIAPGPGTSLADVSHALETLSRVRVGDASVVLTFRLAGNGELALSWGIPPQSAFAIDEEHIPVVEAALRVLAAATLSWASGRSRGQMLLVEHYQVSEHDPQGNFVGPGQVQLVLGRPSPLPGAAGSAAPRLH